MFKSFFPKPGPFFMSAFVWALIAVIFWQAGGGDWGHPMKCLSAQRASGRWTI